MLGKVLLN